MNVAEEILRAVRILVVSNGKQSFSKDDIRLVLKVDEDRFNSIYLQTLLGMFTHGHQEARLEAKFRQTFSTTQGGQLELTPHGQDLVYGREPASRTSGSEAEQARYRAYSGQKGSGFLPGSETWPPRLERSDGSPLNRENSLLASIKANLYELITTRINTSQLDDLPRLIDTFLDLFPGDKAEGAQLCKDGGVGEEIANHFETAARLYKRGLALEPEAEELRYFLSNNLGYSLNQVGKYPEAEPHCREALKIDPNRFNAHKNLGYSLHLQGKFKEAAGHYIVAVEMCPQDPRACCHFEEMVEAHPELLSVDGLRGALERCKDLVDKAYLEAMKD